MVINNKPVGYKLFYFYKLGKDGAIWRIGYGKAEKYYCTGYWDNIVGYSDEDFLNKYKNAVIEISYEDFHKKNENNVVLPAIEV